jgi:hypothetical protein
MDAAAHNLRKRVYHGNKQFAEVFILHARGRGRLRS